VELVLTTLAPPGTGRPFPAGIDGSVANAGLTDECYRRAGLSARATLPGRHGP